MPPSGKPAVPRAQGLEMAKVQAMDRGLVRADGVSEGKARGDGDSDC